MTTTIQPAPSVTGLLAALRREVRGPVLVPTDDAYDSAVRGHNLGYVQRPTVAVGVLDADDVAATVRLAAEHRVRIHVQATGHGATAPVVGGLLILTARLDHVEVAASARTLTVGAGVRSGAAVAAAEAHGLVLPSGSSAEVGLVGYTLGGGLGPLGRPLGWASDHLRSVELVTPDGVRRTVSVGHEPDLFWAVRGGKLGLGVVTAMTFDLDPAPVIVGHRAWFDVADTSELLRRWVSWPEPGASTSAVRWMTVPDLDLVPVPLRGRTVVELTVTTCGDHDHDWPTLTAGLPMIMDVRTEGGLTDWYAGLGDPPGAMPTWQCGRLLTDLSAEAVDALLSCLGPDGSRCPEPGSRRPEPVEGPFLAVELRRLGGRLAEPEDDAVGGRDAAYGLSVIGLPDPALFATVLPAAFARLESALEPWLHGGTQVNFHGPVTPDSPLHRAWRGSVADRLAALRRRIDPHGLFA